MYGMGLLAGARKKKSGAEKKKRAPTAYNLFVRDYLKKHPHRGSQAKAQQGLKDAAAAWDRCQSAVKAGCRRKKR